MSGSAPAGLFGATCSISRATKAPRPPCATIPCSPSICQPSGANKATAAFDSGLVLLREAERSLGLAAMPAGRKTLFQLAELLAVEDPLVDAPVG